MPNLHELIQLLLRPRIAFCVWITAVLVLTVQFPDFLMTAELKKNYGQWIGVVAIFSFLLWIVEIGAFGWSWLRESRKKAEEVAKRNQTIRDDISTLMSQEMDLLTIGLSKNNRTVLVPHNSPFAASLVQKGLMISIPSNNAGHKPYEIPPDVWKILIEDPALIKSKTESL